MKLGDRAQYKLPSDKNLDAPVEHAVDGSWRVIVLSRCWRECWCWQILERSPFPIAASSK